MLEVVVGPKTLPGQIFPEDLERFALDSRIVVIKPGFPIVNLVVQPNLEGYSFPIYLTVDMLSGREVGLKFCSLSSLAEHYLSCHFLIFVFNHDAEMFGFLAKLAGSGWKEIPRTGGSNPTRDTKRVKK